MQLPHYVRRLLLVAILMCCAAPLIAGCAQQQQQGIPPIAQGWTWYHDSRFGFQMPVPPNWRTGSWIATPGQIADCAYHVDLLPPTSAGQPGPGAEEDEPLLMSVVVRVKCSPWRGTQDDPHFTQEQQPITISGKPSILYDDDISGYGIQRVAVADFGGHQYLFNLQAPPKSAQQDLTLYKQMLQGFRAS